MFRSLCLVIASTFTLALTDPARSQETPAASAPAASPSTPAATPTDDVATLKAENDALKKEVADAQRTIAQLQAKLAAQGGAQPAATAPVPAMASDPSTAPVAAAPSGPQKALPLDATNGMVTATALGAAATDAGPSRSYTVVKGDSLWKIAHKMYPGDTKNGVDKLQEANKDAIGGKPLKIGQVLVVPQ